MALAEQLQPELQTGNPDGGAEVAEREARHVAKGSSSAPIPDSGVLPPRDDPDRVATPPVVPRLNLPRVGTGEESDDDDGTRNRHRDSPAGGEAINSSSSSDGDVSPTSGAPAW